jgi:hypothetical protein
LHGSKAALSSPPSVQAARPRFFENDEAGRRNISVAQIKVTLIAGAPKNKRNRFLDMAVGYSLAAR